MALLQLNEKGEQVEFNTEFIVEGMEKMSTSIRDRLDYLADHASIVFSILSNKSNVMDLFVKPLEAVLSGARLDLAALKGSIGDNYLTRANVPPVLWTAVETGFSAIFNLEADVDTLKSNVEDLQGFAEQILEDIANEDTFSDKTAHGKDTSGLARAAFTATAGHPQVINGVLHHPDQKLSRNLGAGAAISSN